MINENYIYVLMLAFALSIIIVMASVCVFMGIVGYHESKTNRQRESAMVAVCTLRADSAKTDTLRWYIKADEECFHVDKKDIKAFDVIRLDQASLGVEDRIVVKFNVKKKQVVATDFGKPIKVEKVDWEQVRDYLNKK